jgi:hypothetical protein
VRCIGVERILVWIIFFSATLLPFISDTNASNCPAADVYSARSRALEAQLQRTCDCSLIPTIMSSSDHQIAAGYAAHCPDWHRTKSRAAAEQYVRGLCRKCLSETSIASRNNSTKPKATEKRLSGAPKLDQSSGSCSDITGTGGSAPRPTNCPPSNDVPPNVQSQINADKSNSQQTNPQQPNLPNNGRTAAIDEAIQKLEEAEAAFRAAGDLAAAENTAEQIDAFRKRASCPALAPEEFWKNTENEEYCSTANCTERGTAYYGMLCYFKYKEDELSLAEREKICKEALAKLTVNRTADETLAEQMFHQKIPCRKDGTPMGLRDRLKRALKDRS